MRTKVGALIAAIITLAGAGVLMYFCYDLQSSIQAQSGVEVLSQIVTMPWLVVLYIALATVLIMALTSSLVSCFSCVTFVKVLAIILLLLTLALAGFAGYEFYQLLGVTR